MPDKRTYIRVDDGIEDNPKVMPLSDKAFRLLVTTWGWCSRKHSDGFIRAAVWEKRGTKKVRDELEAEMVHRPGHDCRQCPPVPDGYVWMHDYLDHQRSAEEIEAAVAKKSDAGRKGNHVRWHRNGAIDPDCEFCPPLSPIDPGPPGEPSHDASQMRSHNGSQVRSQNGRKTSPEDRGQRTDEGSLRDPSGNRAQARAKATRIPDDFAVTAEMITWAREHTPLVGQAETDRFVDYWRAKPGRAATKLDWTATWRNWMRKAQDDATGRSAGRPATPTQSPRVDKAAGYLHPDDPFLQQLTDAPRTLQVIEGGQSA